MPRSPVPTTTKGQSIGDYVLGTSIGKGACSQVRLGRHVPTGTQVVIKSMVGRDVSRELRCLRTLQHRNISRLLEVVVAPEEVHLVMEHVRGGDLREHLERRGRLTERQARAVFRQIAMALHLCHLRGFAHRDIKPDNILLEEDLTAKLADFGLSHEATAGQLLTSWCGTLSYMAPEVLQREPYDGLKADVWGLGASLYKAVTGRVPFPGDSEEKIMDRIVEGRYKPPYYMSEAGRSFLQRLLTVDPDQRPTLEEAMRMPWMDLGPEDLPPDSEPPGEDLDPQVVETMRGMGFREEDIRDSVAGQTFDRIMGTYRILLMTMGRMAMGRMPGRTVQVRPYRPPDTGAATPSSRQGSRASGGSSGPSEASPPCPWAKKISAPLPSLETIASSPPPLESVQALQPEGSPRPSMVRPLCLGVKKTYAPPAPPPSLETIAASPPPLESVQALPPGTRGPAPQLRPGGAPTPRTSNRFRFRSSESKAVKAVKAGNEAVKVENKAIKVESKAVKVENQEGGPPGSSPQEGSPSASPAANTRARPGLAQRAWKTFLKVFCCGVDTIKPRRKRTKVQPGNT
ncbi:sperm motility kinase 4A [Pipistrellus kuhlii]|uniref:non-specific serine/threonine protein kinase n=1 Tax=Pipistrellus kuhlii TaxID=59472 RepID=A0A7J7ZJN1_PIPKU|nr:sperm motility kinase 4A [Pipistrellus kuhlii]KAF6374245.1 hypothetical protein mPipKuh1_009469 [Pipistrellus kuhlii]